MQANSLKISKVFYVGGDVHYIMPHFQRQYSWDKDNWETLLNDAWAIYEEYQEDKEPPEHFLGALVVINDGNRNGVIPAYKLVDGQQRLTTISLLLCAFRDLIQESDSKTFKKIEKMLVNSDEDGDLHFKVLPTNKYGDREAYTKIIRGERETPATTESNIPKAYAFFRKELGRKLDSKEIVAERFFIVLSSCFQVVFIDLDKDESPYKIFESLNAKGKPLEQADLVRNYIAMKLPTAQQEKVFTDQWEKIETLLQEKRTVGKSGLGELTAFMRHYLAMHSRVLCSEEHIYARFRDRCEKFTDSDFIEELSTLRRFAEYYDKLLRPQNEKNQEIKDALHRLNTLELSTAYPFLLSVYDEYDSNRISYADFVEALNLMENYMVRRFICGATTKDLTRLFPTLWRDITNEMASEASFREALINVLVSKKYPSDRSVVQSIRTAKLYENRSQSKIVFVLETVNRHLSLGTGGFTVLDNKASIEHILPQKPSETWKNELGENLESIYQDYLHTLGNLTLVTAEWNSIISNSPFQNKQQHFARHALRINSDYFSHDIQRWDEQAILERADYIAQKFLEIWPAIGESAPLETQPYSKPKAITICGETIAIPKNTWRELIKLTAEWVIKNRPERFEVARQKLPNFFCASISGKNSPPDWHQLSNGIWLYQKGSAKVIINFCRRLLAEVGISESEWNIE